MSIDRRDFLLSPISANAAATAGVTIQDLQNQITALQNNLNALTASVAASRLFRSIKEFGAKGDGVTDDTAAFVAANAYAISQQRSIRTGDTWQPNLVGVKIYLPKGDYLIKTPKALLNWDFVSNPYGLTYEGESISGTVIVYQPTSSGPLCYNNQCLGYVKFENLTFFCNDANSDFFDSVGPYAQNYTFDHCTWIGTWRYGLQLTGTNDNTANTWTKCSFFATFTYYLYCNSTTADQFLDHWFYDCIIWNWCTLIYNNTMGGGHFHMINCDFEGSPATPTYLFYITGPNPFEGVPGMSFINCRVEHRNTNALFLYCEWGFGYVKFEGCDFGGAGSPGTFSPIYFKRGVNSGPAVRFESCSIVGNHEYHYGDMTNVVQQSIVYESCHLLDIDNATDIVKLVYDGSTTHAGVKPVVRFVNCQDWINPGNNKVVDTDVGWDTAYVGYSGYKLVSLKDTAGHFPHNGTYGLAFLPKNAVVTKITWYSKSGTNSGNTSAYAYRIRSSEQTPTILSAVGGSNVSTGFSKIDTPFFQCGTTDATRSVVFEDTAGQSSVLTNSYVIVEYIG